MRQSRTGQATSPACEPVMPSGELPAGQATTGLQRCATASWSLLLDGSRQLRRSRATRTDRPGDGLAGAALDLQAAGRVHSLVERAAGGRRLADREQREGPASQHRAADIVA